MRKKNIAPVKLTIASTDDDFHQATITVTNPDNLGEIDLGRIHAKVAADWPDLYAEWQDLMDRCTQRLLTDAGMTNVTSFKDLNPPSKN
jgi:hypothetical protein